MTRSKAALIHLAISSFALLILTLLTLVFWYTYPHFKHEGVLQILALITLVDVVLGPMLTFMVGRPIKTWSEIRFDLFVIAFVQIAAFGYRAWNIQSQHPEFLLYAEGRFTTIPAS